MQAIMRYELVINEALRSALMFDTPDEQINEFIRFFGKHIGCDRIYIFEDNKKKHVTNNTYEWCSEGIQPEIDFLQGVDVDIIDWWYKAFDKKENVIIQDVETIKKDHAYTYNTLKVQNVTRLVVCPIRYKDEISGFFGVDNPPIDNHSSLTTFLDMIVTLVVSFLKIRNSQNKSKQEAKLSGYSALAQIYISMHYINVKTQKYHIVKTEPEILKYLGVDKINDVEDCFSDHIYGKISGWCRGRYIPVDYDEDGRLLHVLYCVECIDEQKRREDKLLYLAQTDTMTGVSNRRSGEKMIERILNNKISGMMCLVDCDKFKLINDTYGHMAGDEVIIAIAHTLQKSCRDKDIVMRLGGDEFAFFKRLFENLKQIHVESIDNHPVVLSLGACFFDGKEDLSFDELYCRADSAMYESKKIDGYSATIFRKK